MAQRIRRPRPGPVARLVRRQGAPIAVMEGTDRELETIRQCPLVESRKGRVKGRPRAKTTSRQLRRRSGWRPGGPPPGVAQGLEHIAAGGDRRVVEPQHRGDVVGSGQGLAAQSDQGLRQTRLGPGYRAPHRSYWPPSPGRAAPGRHRPHDGARWPGWRGDGRRDRAGPYAATGGSRRCSGSGGPGGACRRARPVETDSPGRSCTGAGPAGPDSRTPGPGTASITRPAASILSQSG